MEKSEIVSGLLGFEILNSHLTVIDSQEVNQFLVVFYVSVCLFDGSAQVGDI